MSAGSRLRELADRWSLGATQVSALERALDLLASDPLAPSAVRGETAVDVHVADSLSALALERVRSARSVADLGSGAGFPGLVLAVVLPGAQVALVESSARRCEFLERMRGAAGAANAHIVRARIEDWVEGIGAHELVTARALAPLPVVCEYAAPLLALGGSLVAWKGAVPDDERLAGRRAAELLGLEEDELIRSAPYAGSVAHHLHCYRKVAQTPPEYPRRAGVARKRPLGAAR